MQLFVPGRICLFGEHSDWAGGYRRSHPVIDKGHAIIAGTNQGLFAEVRPHPSKLIVRSTLDDGSDGGALEVPMTREALRRTAESGGFFSYIAGVAYEMATHFDVSGLVIDNDQTTLPVRKGLSSSAAICVLTARAFNRLYHLNLSTRGEMAYAYAGELLTGSQCGRMDQGCAYGDQPILMTFDGDRVDVKPLALSQPLYFVIADLHAAKDTKQILESLNRAFPVAESSQHQQAQTYLGPINARIVQAAATALQAGDAAQIGTLMQEAQTHLTPPCCPSQLTAPKLTRCSPMARFNPHLWRWESVQGDGSVQFISGRSRAGTSDVDSGKRLAACLRLTLSPRRNQRARFASRHRGPQPDSAFARRLFPPQVTVRACFRPRE